MGGVTRVLVGLEDFEVTGAVEIAAGVLEVSVRVARPDATCVRCGTFSGRVKDYRTCRVRDGLSYERPTTLVWAKRRFGCDTPGRVGKFTESTGEVVTRRRATAPLCAAMTRAAWDRLSLRTGDRMSRRGDMVKLPVLAGEAKGDVPDHSGRVVLGLPRLVAP